MSNIHMYTSDGRRTLSRVVLAGARVTGNQPGDDGSFTLYNIELQDAEGRTWTTRCRCGYSCERAPRQAPGTHNMGVLLWWVTPFACRPRARRYSLLLAWSEALHERLPTGTNVQPADALAALPCPVLARARRALGIFSRTLGSL